MILKNGLFFFLAFLLTGFSALAQNSDSTCCTAPVEDSTVAPRVLVEQFIDDLAHPDVALDVVLSKHVLTTKSDDEFLDYLLVSLQEIRINLMSKNLADIQILNYMDLPRKETADIDPEGKDVEHMYFLKHRTRQVVALFVDKAKIASFTLVSKGRNKAHFVTY